MRRRADTTQTRQGPCTHRIEHSQVTAQAKVKFEVVVMTEDDDLGGSHAGFGAFWRCRIVSGASEERRKTNSTDLYAKREFGSQPLTRKGRCRRTMRFCARNRTVREFSFPAGLFNPPDEAIRAYVNSLHRDVASTANVRILRLQGGVLVLEGVRHGVEHLAVFAIELVDHAVVEGLGADDKHVESLARQEGHLVLVPLEGRVLCREWRVKSAESQRPRMLSRHNHVRSGQTEVRG